VSEQLIMWGIRYSQYRVRGPLFVFNSSFHSCVFNYPVINLLYVLLIDLVVLSDYPLHLLHLPIVIYGIGEKLENLGRGVAESGETL
jgi:hypothetical protein